MEDTQKLANAYSNDLDDNLENELMNFTSFIKNYVNEQNREESFKTFLYRINENNNLQRTFPNLEVALCIYLSIMVANTTGVRSYLKLKLTKNRLRVRISQDRVVARVRISSEIDILASEFSVKKT